VVGNADFKEFSVMMSQEFGRLVEQTIRGMWQRHPVTATFMGIHDHDDRRDDLTPEAHAADLAAMRHNLDRLLATPAADLSPLEQTDRRILASELEGNIWLSEELRPLYRFPQAALEIALSGAFILLIREFAPLEDHLAVLLARAEAVPALLTVVKYNLRAGDNIPAVWVDGAEQMAEGGLQFWNEMVPAFAHQVPALRDKLVSAASMAGESFGDYIGFLRNELRPRADGDFAIGRELFDWLLRTQHMLPYDSEDLREIGAAIVAQTEREMHELAATIEPGRPWHAIVADLKRDHPPAQGMLKAYR